LSWPGSINAVIIDSVDRHFRRDLEQLDRLSLKLACVLETHARADHVTSAGKLCQRTSATAVACAGITGFPFLPRRSTKDFNLVVA
jgi:glyoxylase-like metal-dependent hydrolase (beta-lactamase superfamily II)